MSDDSGRGLSPAITKRLLQVNRPHFGKIAETDKGMRDLKAVVDAALNATTEAPAGLVKKLAGR